jgi:Rha family phage regulatory protein
MLEDPKPQVPRAPIVKIDVAGGRIFVDSRDLANFVDKEHRNVLRDIDSIRGVYPNLDIPPSWFQEVRSINDQNGQTYRFFELAEDDMSLLFMNWSTERLLPYKVEYLKAVRAMKEELDRLRAQPAGPFDVAALRPIVLRLGERSDEVTGVAQCLENAAVGEGDRFVECARPGHQASTRRPAAHAAYLRAVQSR